MIPPRLAKVEDKEVRFYVSAPSSVKLRLTDEAMKRGLDMWTLAGLVLTDWISSGCPESIPCPSPSPSLVGHGEADQ